MPRSRKVVLFLPPYSGKILGAPLGLLSLAGSIRAAGFEPRIIDGALDPVSYFLPFVANRAKSIVTAINERSLNLKLFADVEDSVLDLYSAARNGYLQRRRAAIALAARERDQEWAWMEKSPAVEPQPQTASSGNRENHT